MRPVNAGIDNRDVNALAFIAVRHRRERRHVVRIFSIELWRANVRHAVVELRRQLLV